MPDFVVETKWLLISGDGLSRSRKTGLFTVRTKDGSIELGRISWFGRWRRYAFFPARDTVFEHQCLGDIAKFLDDRTKQHNETCRINREATWRPPSTT